MCEVVICLSNFPASALMNGLSSVATYEKSVEVCICYSFHRLRLSHVPFQSRTSNARNPRRCIIYKAQSKRACRGLSLQTQCGLPQAGGLYKTSHEHLPLLCSDCILEICEISRRQEQSAKVNAFPYIVTPFPTAYRHQSGISLSYDSAQVSPIFYLWLCRNTSVGVTRSPRQ